MSLSKWWPEIASKLKRTQRTQKFNIKIHHFMKVFLKNSYYVLPRLTSSNNYIHKSFVSTFTWDIADKPYNTLSSEKLHDSIYEWIQLSFNQTQIIWHLLQQTEYRLLNWTVRHTCSMYKIHRELITFNISTTNYFKFGDKVIINNYNVMNLTMIRKFEKIIHTQDRMHLLSSVDIPDERWHLAMTFVIRKIKKRKVINDFRRSTSIIQCIEYRKIIRLIICISPTFTYKILW